VSDVEASVAAGVELVRQEGLLIRQVVIPQLHEQMREKIL
jgi:microcompartment protein CcmL/EutN